MINLKKVLFYLITIVAANGICQILDPLPFGFGAILTQIIALFVMNFLILWVLIKAIQKSAKVIPFVASFITMALSFLIFQINTDRYEALQYLSFSGICISIFIINYSSSNKLSPLTDSILLFSALLSYHFLSRLLFSFCLAEPWYFPYDYQDLIIFSISLIASIIYFYTETKKMGTASTASVPTVPDHPKTVVVTCPTCKTDYEVQQQTCPGCGYPFAGTEKEKAVFIAQQILKKGHLAGAKKRITAARVILWIIGGLNIIFASSDTVSLVTGILFILCGFWTYKKPVISISISLIILIISYAPPEILLTPYIPFAGLLWKVILLITFIIALVSAVKSEKIKKESKFLQSQK